MTDHLSVSWASQAASTLPSEGCSREEYVAGQLALSHVMDTDSAYPTLTPLKQQAAGLVTLCDT